MTIPFCLVALLFMILQGTTSTIIAIPLATLTVPEDHLRRVQMLRRGFQSLKDALIDRADKSRESQFLSGSHRKEMQSLRSAIDAAAAAAAAAAAEQPDTSAAADTTPAGKPSRIGANASTIIIAADAIFSQLADGDLRLEEFIGLLKGAGSIARGVSLLGYSLPAPSLVGWTWITPPRRLTTKSFYCAGVSVSCFC